MSNTELPDGPVELFLAETEPCEKPEGKNGWMARWIHGPAEKLPREYRSLPSYRFDPKTQEYHWHGDTEVDTVRGVTIEKYKLPKDSTSA